MKRGNFWCYENWIEMCQELTIFNALKKHFSAFFLFVWAKVWRDASPKYVRNNRKNTPVNALLLFSIQFFFRLFCLNYFFFLDQEKMTIVWCHHKVNAVIEMRCENKTREKNKIMGDGLNEITTKKKTISISEQIDDVNARLKTFFRHRPSIDCVLNWFLVPN